MMPKQPESTGWFAWLATESNRLFTCISKILDRRRPVGIKPLKVIAVLSCSLERNFPTLVVAIIVSSYFSSTKRHLPENVVVLPYFLPRA